MARVRRATEEETVPATRLTLRKENLAELSAAETALVAGGAPSGPTNCATMCCSDFAQCYTGWNCPTRDDCLSIVRTMC